jgi:hypothetical protein
MRLVVSRSGLWEEICAPIQAELTVVGAWHLEDEIGATANQQTGLESGRTYQIREMPALTRGLLRTAHDDERHALEEILNRGMNIELHRDRFWR